MLDYKTIITVLREAEVGKNARFQKYLKEFISDGVSVEKAISHAYNKASKELVEHYDMILENLTEL